MKERPQTLFLQQSCSSGEILYALVSVLFADHVDVHDVYLGLTSNSALKLWYENNVELYKPVDAPKGPKRKVLEDEAEWKQRVKLHAAKLTNWSNKASDTEQKYRQKKNQAFASFAEGQTWMYNHCAASFESSDKATIQSYEPATFVAELMKADSTVALDDLRFL